jgi:Zn-dependent protease
MSDYYKVDSRKITLREYWNILPSWKVLIPWIAGRLSISIDFGSGFRQPKNVKELEIPEPEFSAQARAKLQPLLNQCLQLGFHSPRFYTFESLRRDTRTSFIVLLHNSGEFSLRLMHTLGTQVNPPVENQLVVLLSQLHDGTYFFTSDQKAKFKSPPGVTGTRLVGASVSEMVESHQQKLAQIYAGNPPQRVGTMEATDTVWDKYEHDSIEFGIKRGLYKKLSPEEEAHEDRVITSAQIMTTTDGEHADVLLELSHLQNKKASWGGAIFILLVSLGLFVGAGAQQWSLAFVAILVPVLFIHELGHYLAMRAFNYRNLRMFFIPFFGAAVSGQHYNVPGWKKVVVSLMGPVPGIVLAAVIGGAGLVFQVPLLTKIAIITMLLNGFNLLPLLPMDGGWVFHALLFSRHYWLDTAFRLTATIGLMAAGMYLDSKLLIYVGIPMLFSIPLAYKNARIAAELRRRGITEASADDQNVPPETAHAIITELKKAMPGKHTNRMVAERTLQIFETLNARPPGWGATVGLLSVHLLSLSMAVVFGAVFIVGQDGDFRRIFRKQTTTAAQHPLTCDQLLSWRGNSAAAQSEAEQITIIATFVSIDGVAKAFRELTNQLPANASLRMFGNSLLLTLPAEQDAARKKWLTDLQSRAKRTFVDSAELQSRFTGSCVAPNETAATAILEEIEVYFKASDDLKLIPPWHPNDLRSQEERHRHFLARQTYAKIQHAQETGYHDPTEFVNLQKKVLNAQRQGDKAAVKALQVQFHELAEQRKKQSYARVLSGADGPVDTNTATLFMAYSESLAGTNSGSENLLKQLSEQMGQLSRQVDGHAAAGDLQYSTQFGMVSRKGARLDFTWVSFHQVAIGAPTLIEWLCAKGCRDFKYDFRGGYGLDEEDLR